MQEDLIDENSLLQPEDFRKPTNEQLEGGKEGVWLEENGIGLASCEETDREGKKSRAYANCTCGLAEQLDDEAKAKEPIKSSCGNVWIHYLERLLKSLLNSLIARLEAHYFIFLHYLIKNVNF